MHRVGGEPGRAKGAHRRVSAVSAEIVGGTLPEKRFSRRDLCRSVPVQHTRVGREDRTGGGAAYNSTSRVSAVMLARIGPVKPFLYKDLIAHSEACGRTGQTAHAQPLRSQSDACAASAASPAARRGRTGM